MFSPPPPPHTHTHKKTNKACSHSVTLATSGLQVAGYKGSWLELVF